MVMRPQFQVRLLAISEAMRIALTLQEKDEVIRLTLEVYDDSAKYEKENFAFDRLSRSSGADLVEATFDQRVSDDWASDNEP